MGENLNLEVDINLWDNLKRNVGYVVKLAIIRKIDDLRMLVKVRDMMMLLPQRQKPLIRR